jgi:hypothetical protein
MSKRDVPFVVAGHTWTIPDVEVKEEQDGRQFISAKEMKRVNASIAAAILLADNALSGEEFSFFMDLTGTQQKTIASLLHCTSQAISRWKKVGFPPLQSDVLREYLFAVLFDAALLAQKQGDVRRGLTPAERVKSGVNTIEALGIVAHARAA